MRDPNLQGIVNDLTIRGLRELIELAQARLLQLGDSEELAKQESRSRF